MVMVKQNKKKIKNECRNNEVLMRFIKIKAKEILKTKIYRTEWEREINKRKILGNYTQNNSKT